MRTTICLVRHGETDWNRAGRLQGHEDIALNAIGAVQAQRAARYLAQEQWDALVTSPLKRARKTAKIIAQQVKVPLEEMAELRERNFGAASGLTNDEVAWAYPDGNVPGREERTEVARRSMDALERIARSHEGRKVIVVSHGAVINAILAVISHREIGSRKTVLKNACLSRLVYEDRTWEILVYNSTEHLEPG